MHTIQEENTVVEPQRRRQDVSCPRCSSAMVETDRIVENGFAYIWYECSAPDCTEQWLAKWPATAG
jgi:hypothetical protein